MTIERQEKIALEKKKEIIVIGHKNPDTDSICSAISYAYLKNAITGTKQYVPRRCGEVSKETAYVLDQFGIEAPEYIKDVRTQVQDIELRTTAGISGGISIRKAYTTMKAEKAFTLPVVSEENHLQGLITIGDIAASDMDVYDNRIVSKAATPYQNIVDTLDGTVLCGDISGCFTGGKVTIAANSPDLMQEYISAGDLVIMGNRFESQFFAVETGVSCIVLCTHNQVNETIMQRAREKGTVIISSPYDSYTVARLINQSMPVEYFMTKEKLLTFHMDDYANDVKEVMSKTRHRYFPVVGEDDRYLGLISKRNFLDSNHKQVILVDHNEKSQAVDGIEFADILEIIDHHRLGSLETVNPVFFRNQPLGCTGTIIYQMFQENQVEIPKEIAGLLCAAILSDTLMFRSPTCTPLDEAAGKALAEIAGIEIQPFAEAMFSAGADLASRTDEEIFYQDYKAFTVWDVNFGVGQLSSMNAQDLRNIQQRLEPFMEELLKKENKDMIMILLTNILEESSTLLFKGPRAKEILSAAYGDHFDGDTIYLPGVVSRKKQLIPDLISAIRQ